MGTGLVSVCPSPLSENTPPLSPEGRQSDRLRVPTGAALVTARHDKTTTSNKHDKTTDKEQPAGTATDCKRCHKTIRPTTNDRGQARPTTIDDRQE